MKPVILAIAGGTASGKTTLAKAVVAALGDQVTHISHDRYYKTVDPVIATHPDRVTLYNYDHPDALETARLVADLKALKAGHNVRVPDYDFSSSSRSHESTWETFEARPFIVVEGILILTNVDLLALFDHIVFVSTPDDIRLARRMLRDITERGQAPHEVVNQYLTAVRPMHEQWVAPSETHAGLVVHGDKPVDGLVQAVLKLIGVKP